MQLRKYGWLKTSDTPLPGRENNKCFNSEIHDNRVKLAMANF